MWIYTKQLEYPVNITNPDPRMAKLLMALYGGPDSELASGLRYLTQRFTMPDDRCRATLNDIGTEELAHWEMLGTMIYQCMRGASYAQIDEAGMAGYYTMHSRGVFPADPNGVPFTTAYIACTGDPVADLHEDLASEQKARATYEHLMTLTDDKSILDPLNFLREREIVHYQRFGEAKRTRWRVTKRAAEQNSRKSSKMVACGCLTLKSMVMGAHPLTARLLRFPQCGHPPSERPCHSVRQSKGRA